MPAVVTRAVPPPAPRQRPGRRSHSPGRGSEDVRSLLVAVLRAAVTTLQDWSDKFPRFATRSPKAQDDALRAAQEAAAWILDVTETDSHRLTFRECCDALDVDPEQFADALFAKLDEAALNALWTLPAPPPSQPKQQLDRSPITAPITTHA